MDRGVPTSVAEARQSPPRDLTASLLRAKHRRASQKQRLACRSGEARGFPFKRGNSRGTAGWEKSSRGYRAGGGEIFHQSEPSGGVDRGFNFATSFRNRSSHFLFDVGDSRQF